MPPVAASPAAMVLRRKPQGVGGGRGSQHVVDVEVANQARLYGQPSLRAAGNHQPQPGAQGSGGNIMGAIGYRPVEAVCHLPWRPNGAQPLIDGVVGIEDRRPPLAELGRRKRETSAGGVGPAEVFKEAGLGGKIAVEGAVVVQVLMGDIGDHGHVEEYGADPFLGQAVGGGLQYAVGDAGVDHAPQVGLHHRRLRGGDVQRQRFARRSDGRMGGRKHAHGHPAVLQHVEKDVAGCGFAVGAGDADHDQAVARKRVPRGGQPGVGHGGVCHLQIDHTGRQRRRRPAAHHYGGAPFDSLGNEGMTVAAGPHAGHEAVALLDAPGVLQQGAYGDVWAVIRRRLGQRRTGDGGAPVGQQAAQPATVGSVSHRRLLQRDRD